jgi:hypothetical protein
MALQTHTYAALLQQIHSDLRIQHPEWIEPNGESPMCDSYEARLMELLDALDTKGIQQKRDCDDRAKTNGGAMDNLFSRQLI